MDRAVEKIVVRADEIVLVTAKGVAAKMVDTVVVHVHRIFKAQIFDRAHDLTLSRPVVCHYIFQRFAFGGGIFEVRAHRVDIEPRAVP